MGLKKAKVLLLASLILSIYCPKGHTQLIPKLDLVAPDANQEPILTPEEVDFEKRKFYRFIKELRAHRFVGMGQYILSSLNLSLEMNATYDLESNGSVLFHVSTNGNSQVAAGDVTFPLQARVYFEVKDSQGRPIIALVDGMERPLRARRNVLYLVETERGFNERKSLQAKFVSGPVIGQFIAEVEYDLFSQNIKFYEIESDNSLLKLVRKGTLNARSPRP